MGEAAAGSPGRRFLLSVLQKKYRIFLSSLQLAAHPLQRQSRFLFNLSAWEKKHGALCTCPTDFSTAEIALGGNTYENSLKILPRQQGETGQARGICLSASPEKRFSEKKAFWMPFGKFVEEEDYRLKVGQQDG